MERRGASAVGGWSLPDRDENSPWKSLRTVVVSNSLAGYALAALLFILGAALIFVAFNRGLQPYLSLGESTRNWGSLLSARPSAMSIMGSTPFGYRAQVPHYRGWYRSSGDQAIRGRASRVHVAPDQIARIGYRDDWQGHKLLDTSAFCLQAEDAPESVDYLARSGRFELVFYDDHFRSSDGYPLNCHLPVHFWIDLALDDTDSVNRLMDRVPLLQREIEERVAAVLREELSRREYRRVFYEVPKIVDRLNTAWAEDGDLQELRQVLGIHFSALVVKPREEAERRFLSTPGAGIERLRDRIRRVDEDIKQEERYWTSRRDDTRAALQHAVTELLEYPPVAIRESVVGLKETVSGMGNHGHVVESVDGTFLAGQRALARGAEKVVGALHALRELIEALTEEDSRLRAALVQPPQQDAESPSPRLIRLPDDSGPRLRGARTVPGGER